MYTFKVIEEKENPLESVIEKSGLTTKFTLQDIKDHLEYTNKVLKETEAQKFAGETQDSMALDILPILKDIPNDKWQLVYAYAERQIRKEVEQSIIDTSKETIESYQKQLETIKETTGLSYE